jgi:hypothetical protein
LFERFENAEMAPLLVKLIEESAAPLASIESNFAVDSTGFGTATYRRWYDAKYGKEMSEHAWLKAHAMVGVKTGIVTAVKVTGSNSNDCPELPALLTSTTERFDVVEVSADKGYLRRRCGPLEMVAKVLGMKDDSLSKILRGTRGVTARVAFRVARFAGVSVTDLVKGQGVPAGTCPFCGHAPDEVP